MNLYVLTLLVLSVQQSLGDFECGKINNNAHYQDKKKSRLEDYAWLGRVHGCKYKMLPKKVFNGSTFICTANLITRKHLLTSVFDCINYVIRPQYVVFGDADYVNHTNKMQWKYTIRDMAIHPTYQQASKINDIGIIRLERDVEFNKYVHPICLPPMSSYTYDYTEQYYQLVGHLRNQSKSEKLRSVAHIVPTDICAVAFQFVGRILCTSLVSRRPFSAGSALMDVNSDDPNNKTLHIIGTLSYGYKYFVFTNTALYINWIKSIINYTS